jgi:hypothetical protein
MKTWQRQLAVYVEAGRFAWAARLLNCEADHGSWGMRVPIPESCRELDIYAALVDRTDVAQNVRELLRKVLTLHGH